MIKLIALLFTGISLFVTGYGQDQVFNSGRDIPFHNSKKINIRHQSDDSMPGLQSDTEPVYREKLDSIIEYNYNNASGNWDRKFVKSTYTYDDDFNEVLWTYTGWDGDDQSWKNLLKEETEYDEHGNMTGYISWVGNGVDWNRLSKASYRYDGDKLVESLNCTWKLNLDNWQKTEKWLYSYDDTGKPVKDSLYWWREADQDWELRERIDYTYVNGKTHYIFKAKRDIHTNEWNYYEKDWYLYDNIKWLLRTITRYSWYNAIDDWKMISKKGLIHENDLVEGFGIVSRSIEDDLWETIFSERYTYDYSIESKEIMYPYVMRTSERASYHHKVIREKQFIRDLKAGLEERQIREVNYYYSPVEDIINAGKPDVGQEIVKVYPNPARDQVHINIPEKHGQGFFELFDMNGRKILSKSIHNEDILDISSVSPGIYFYQVVTGTFTGSGRLVMQ